MVRFRRKKKSRSRLVLNQKRVLLLDLSVDTYLALDQKPDHLFSKILLGNIKENWLSLEIQLYRLVCKEDRFFAVFSGQKIPDHVKLGEFVDEMKIDLERIRFVLDLV